MKKIITAFFFAFLLISSAALAASPSQGPRQFMDYPWRTPFSVIQQEIGLQPSSYSILEFLDSYEGINNKIRDSEGNLRVSFSYHFYQNQLVSTTIKFYQKADHERIAQYIQSHWGRPNSISLDGKIHFYQFPTASVTYRTGSTPQSPTIFGQLTLNDASFHAKSIELQTQKSSTK